MRSIGEGEIHAFTRKSLLSERTKDLYRYYLLDLGEWLAGRRKRPANLSPDDALDWLDAHPQWGSSSRYSAICAARAFYKFHFGEKHAVISLRVRRDDPGPQRTLDEQGLMQLISSFDTTTIKGIRDLALVLLLVDTGLRASEVCRAELRYLNMAERRLDVIVKGGHWAACSFFDYTAAQLEQWLGVRSIVARPTTKTVFVSIGGLRPGRPLTRDGLRSVFRRLGSNSGLGLISPHDLRRTMATLSIRAGAPTRIVQLAGRWKSIRMVERYSRALNPKDFAPYSPANNLMGLDEEGPG